MGLTGARLNGAEMLAFGIGTHFIPSKNLKSLENVVEKMIASLDSPSVATMSMIINKFAQEVQVKPDSTYLRLDMINQYASLVNHVKKYYPHQNTWLHKFKRNGSTTLSHR
ncbi:hypothetical protein L1987_49884 [Smallanthus sonchifolius]|uniref:Uncharacterized protein n=1 Tax=Smallanthus sonchifolius TaxID=185202 RepID=A0ACB9FVM4_9ASTR|nr:hypothetical protein L1987_49884 [Smallanthus sonchifolius]